MTRAKAFGVSLNTPPVSVQGQRGPVICSDQESMGNGQMIVAADNLTPSLGLSKLFTGLGHSLVT